MESNIIVNIVTIRRFRKVSSNLFRCEHCDYKATTKSSLQQHMKSIHDGVKYSCKYCDYKATPKSNLQQHVKSLHDLVKYSCEYCDYKATQKGNLEQHVKSIHDGVISIRLIISVIS